MNVSKLNKNALKSLMSEISEEHWCAGWLIDLEYILWEAVEGISQSTYDGKVSELKDLRDGCNGWWYFDSINGNMFENIEDFKIRYNKWKAKQYE